MDAKLPTALAITHVAFENLGSLGPELERAGYKTKYTDACSCDLAAIDPFQADILVVLGGPIGVYEQDTYPFLSVEIDMIRARVRAKRPTLGICLGAQLIAAACGSRVYPGAKGKEIGWGPIRAGSAAARHPAFTPLLAPELQLLHWHGDTFDLPEDADHLAETSLYSNQAFAIGKHVLGLQFHPEVTAKGLEPWYVGHACELGHAGIDVASLRKNAHAFAPKLELAAQRFWREWLAEISS